jgi:tetratricopeptide (TPR) repeat protein
VNNQRIEDLRRRIQKDPASIAFAQLAEEHRRAGQFEEAVRVCRAGLAQHPAYLSARITLGRALIETGRLDEAATEFEYVLKAAPDNLSAIRELTEINQRRRHSAPPQVAAAAPHPAVDHQAAFASFATVPESPTINHQPPTANHQPLTTNHQPPSANHQPSTAVDPVLSQLEAWLAVLADERAARTAGI